MPESGGLEMVRDSNGFWKTVGGQRKRRSPSLRIFVKPPVTRRCDRCSHVCVGIAYRLLSSGEIVCKNHTKDLRSKDYVQVTLKPEMIELKEVVA